MCKYLAVPSALKSTVRETLKTQIQCCHSPFSMMFYDVSLTKQAEKNYDRPCEFVKEVSLSVFQTMASYYLCIKRTLV